MAEGNGFLQYIYDKAAANDQYLQSVIPEDDGGTYDSFGDGGFIDSAVNATLSGAGGAIGGFGTYMDQSYGIGGSLADLGMSMQVGRQARRNWSVQEAMNNPLEYIADPNGMVYDAFNTVGSQAPDFAASYLATVATAPIGGVGGVAMKAALTAARAKMALSAASKLGKAISVGSKAGGIGLDAAKFVASKVPNMAGIVTGGFVDAASEAGNTYHAALDNGATQEEALNAMDTDFMDNIGLSTVQNAVSLSMLKGAAKAPYRLLGGAEDVAEDTAKKGILGALSEAGGKVADFADSNIATRFLTRSVPSIAVEGYTEGLQQEFQNNAVHGYDINYNPINMSNDSIEEAGHATFGMLPMGILGAIGRRRGRASSHVGGTNDSEKTVASPIDHVVNQGVQNNVSAPPTSNVSVSDMPMTNSPIESGPIESTPIETTPVDAGELTQGDIDSIVLEAQKQAEAQAAKTATSKAAPPASGRNINDLIAQNMDNPSDTDIAERELYGKDSADYAAYQAIANVLSTETSPLGYNPVHGSANMTASEKADLINAMVNSPELTMINSPKEAAPIADVLETRNNNKVLQNQAQSLVTEKQKLGLPVTEADIATTTAVHPNKGQLQAMRVQIKDKKAQNKATFKAKKEAATNIVNTALADLEKKGASSDYYINEKGEISPSLRSQIEENGLSVEEVAPKIAKRSQKVRDEKNRVRNEAVKALNETVKADLEKNGVKSPFYSKDGTLDSLSNETKRHLTRSSMGQIDNTTLDHIAKLSALADERAAAKSEKERALKAEMDRIEKINKNDVGIHVDPKDLEGMTPSKRKEFLTRKEKQVQKVSASKKELEADIVKARELGINPKELEGKAPAERKKYLESKEKERRKNSEKDSRRKSDKTQAKLVDTNEYGVKVGDMEGMTRSQRKKHLSQKRKEIDRRKETAEKDSEKGYKEIRHDKGKEKDTSHFANALSKLAKEGKQKDVVEAVHHFINNFFEYKSLATDSIKRHFSPKFRDRVESALREYVNARTENDFNNDAQVAKVTQLVKESMEEARKPTSKAEKAPKEKSKGEERITYSTTSDQSEETKSLNLGKALKKAKSKGEDVRIASHANDMLIQELREGKPKDGRDEIHYWLHHEELTKKYEIKVPKGEPKKLNRAEILVKGYGSAKRNDGKRNVVSPFVKWVGEGPERAAGARNFPSERVIQKLIDGKVYTREEIERARAEYEHYKDQADKNLKTKLEEMANERKELADKARADARDKNTSKTSEATITYETEPAYTVDKLGTVKSSRVNMTVKVSPSDIKDRENVSVK